MVLRRRPPQSVAADAGHRAEVDRSVQPLETHRATALAEALVAIDGDLTTMAYRQIVSADEVSDLLLDLRLVLLAAEFNGSALEEAQIN
jgi:glyceraldehyde-3-phosphate dehydrogenase/erythrose-4-phosphate dehydrogenase